MSLSRGKSPKGFKAAKNGVAVSQDLREMNEGNAGPGEPDVNLRAVFNAMRDGIIVVDAETRQFVYTNSAMCRMLGYSEKELLALTPADIHPRDLAGFVGARFAAVVAREIQVVDGIPTLRKDGSTFIGDISASLATIRGRECVIAVFRDGTLRHNAETVQKEREAQLRRAESLVRLGHFSFDADGSNFICSEGLKPLGGWSRDFNPTFADCLAVTHPEDRERVAAVVSQAVQERRGYDLEFRVVHADGTELVVQARGEVVDSGPGTPLRCFGTMLDITERKRAEQFLRESEERLRYVIDATNDGIWDWDFLTGRGYRSPRWKEILGYADEELPDTESSFFHLLSDDKTPLHPDDKMRVEEALKRHLAGDAAFSEEFRLRHKDGTWRWVLSRGKAIRDSGGQPVSGSGGQPISGPGGQPIRMIGAIRDITERKEAEAELRAGEERLRLIFNAHRDPQSLIRVEPGGRYMSESFNQAHLDYARQFIPDPGRYLERDREEFLSAVGVPENEIAVAVAQWREVAAEKTPARYEATWTIGPDRRRETGDVTIVPILNRDGACTHLLWTAHIMTERKQAELALARHAAELAQANAQLVSANERFHRVIEAAPNGILIVNPEGLITFANAQAEVMFKCGRDELLKQSIETFVPASVRKSHSGMRSSFFGDPRAKAMGAGRDLFAVRKDGSEFPVEIGLNPIEAEGKTSVQCTVVDITERKHAEARIAGERDRLRQILDSQFGFVGVFSLDGFIVEINKTALDLARLKRSDVLGRRFWEVGWLQPGTEPELEQAIRRAALGEVVRMDIVAQFPAVGRRDVDAIFSPLRDERGKVVNVIGFGVDVTDRKQAEELLRRREAQFSVIVNAGSDIHMLFRARESDGLEVEFVNRAWVDFFAGIAAGDFSTSRIAGLSDRELLELLKFPPERIAEVTALYRKVRAAKTPVRYETPAFAHMRHQVLDVLVQPVLDSAGHCTHILWTGRNITERKRTEELAIKNEARLNEAQRIAQVGSWELDLTDQHLIWSDEVFRIFEIDKDAFGASYQAFLDLVHPEDRDAVDSEYRRSLETRQPYETTHRLVMPDGRVKYVFERCRSDFEPDGRPIRSVGTVQDITEKKLAEDRIEAQLREKEVLLREIHHRVKNNLQIISGLLHLQTASIRDPDVVQLFEDSRRRVQAMASVHDILYRSPDLGHIAIAPYIEKLVSALRAANAQAGRDIRLVTRVSVPHLSLQCAVPCGLIVSELTTNAFKYAFEGRDKGTVGITLEETAPGRLRLAVQDDGRGMPRDTSRATSRTTGGFGLRLVHLLAEQIGGSVEISSGPGTAVSVTFPDAR